MNQQNGNGADREGFAALLLRLRGQTASVSRRRWSRRFEATPRRGFLPGQWQTIAWSDRMVPIECGEAIEGADLQASVIARLQIEPGHRVLEIGTGSGYTAAVMARLAARVVTVDRYKTLAEQARQRFEALGIVNVVVRQADGSNGLPGEGPFDRIVVVGGLRQPAAHLRRPAVHRRHHDRADRAGRGRAGARQADQGRQPLRARGHRAGAPAADRAGRRGVALTARLHALAVNAAPRRRLFRRLKLIFGTNMRQI